jgi:hypothetical protein
MGIESLIYFVPACAIVAVFLVGLAVIASLLLRRIIRAYVGDQGVDVPATMAFLLMTVMMVICIGCSWIALHAPD